MSVQAGIRNFDDRPADRGFLGKVSSAIEQYAPDGRNTYIDGSLGMVYGAFHTTLESRVERQPYVSERRNAIMWDGRLDNRADLVRELHTDLGPELTDVVIVVAAYEKWGTGCFAKLVGDWALSIWNPSEHVLILARDYAGIRHLYYYLKYESVFWCTNLASLLKVSGDKFTVNGEYIGGYLAFWPAAELTPYQEINAVPPGKFVCIRATKASSHSYSALSSMKKIRYKTDAEYEEHFRHVFRLAVQRRLRSDSPVLADLSGGLDSSSIVCMGDGIIAMEGAQTPRLDTISFYEDGIPDNDDFFYFTMVEKKRGRMGFHLDVGKYGMPRSLANRAFAPVPGHLGSWQELETQRFNIMRSGGYRVLLTGIGGDELLGGVPDFTGPLSDLIVNCRFSELAKQLCAWSLIKRKPWVRVLLETCVLLLPAPVRFWLSKEIKVGPWVQVKFALQHQRAIRYAFDEARGWPPSRRGYAQALATLTRQMGQLEPGTEEKSHPYLDQTLVEFIMSIPADQVLRPGQRRSLMRRALAGIVPAEILSRRTKAVGERHHIAILEKHWNEIESILVSDRGFLPRYMDDAGLLQALREMKNGKLPRQLIQLMKALSLELWLRDVAARGILDASAYAPSSTGMGLAESRVQQQLQSMTK
jgi:asparagine synthase (glutamine-hydrolysing)